MTPALLDTTIVVIALAGFGAAYLAAMVATRPTPVTPAAATPDLGDEPPAVASLLVNRWRLTADVAEATLIDLAARGHLEFRQAGDDPMQTTIHLRRPDQPAQLSAYEQRVLTRIQDLAVDGVVPVTALSFRNKARAKQWTRRLHHEVVADARARGLSRRRMSGAVTGALVTVAAFSTGWVTVAAVRWAMRDDEAGIMHALWFGLFVFLVLASIAARPAGERDTAAGQQAAARWLGVRDWLRGHEQFADLPPAAVTVWDRYLAYGSALGVTHTTSEVLDLGLGDRTRVWSSYGGAWRRVRVRYPKLLARYGSTAPGLVARGTVAGVAGAVLLGRVGAPELRAPGPLDSAPLQEGPLAIVDVLQWYLAWLAVVLLAYGGYTVVRTLLDLVTTRTITGEVLWVQPWKHHSRRDGNNRPWLHYLAVHDGRAEQTTAWGLPHRLVRDVTDRDIVTIRARPWTRRVVDLTVVEHGRSRRLRDAPVDAVDGHALAEAPDRDEGWRALKTAVSVLTGTPGSKLGIPGAQAQQLLTAEEVGAALGIAVRPARLMPKPEPLATAVFDAGHHRREVLKVGMVSDHHAEWIMEQLSSGAVVPDVADAAHVHDDRGAVRVGEVAAVLTLVGDGCSRRDALPHLLRLAADRLPRERGPADDQATTGAT